MARARATIGGPSFESRTPCSAATFQRTTTLSPVSDSAPRAATGDRPRADTSPGINKSAPPAPACFKNWRRVIAAAHASRNITFSTAAWPELSLSPNTDPAFQEDLMECQWGDSQWRDFQGNRCAWPPRLYRCLKRHVVASAEAGHGSGSTQD